MTALDNLAQKLKALLAKPTLPEKSAGNPLARKLAGSSHSASICLLMGCSSSAAMEMDDA